MGLYAKYLFPRFLELALDQPFIARHRAELLASVSGEVLEIGFGTGLNLRYYPERVRKLTTVDANEGMNKLANRRIAAGKIEVVHKVLDAARLPFNDNSFDSVVSTFTLCSIAGVNAALAEVHRVLKAGGQFFFLEHGLSPEANVQRWQRRLTPLNKMVADGCHIDRDINALLAEKFRIVELKQFYNNSMPKTHGYFYQGIAVK